MSGAGDNAEGPGLKKSLGLVDATMLVVSSVIGVGIFFTPGAVAQALPNRTWFFLAWLTGGLLSLAGALANAELGAMFPRAGGDYVYLREAYHPIAGFLVGWLSFFVIYAGTVATLAVAGDWTDTGWPATMEGAVRSGYLAAEAILARAGRPTKLLQPDL